MSFPEDEPFFYIAKDFADAMESLKHVTYSERDFKKQQLVKHFKELYTTEKSANTLKNNSDKMDDVAKVTEDMKILVHDVNEANLKIEGSINGMGTSALIVKRNTRVLQKTSEETLDMLKKMKDSAETEKYNELAVEVFMVWLQLFVVFLCLSNLDVEDITGALIFAAMVVFRAILLFAQPFGSIRSLNDIWLWRCLKWFLGLIWFCIKKILGFIFYPCISLYGGVSTGIPCKSEDFVDMQMTHRLRQQ
eukprot:TRINITY_DN1966_c0_g3_i1.p1 TRINITY_DN1966_c0_g3~~TRINITY_DN1966_c0_g3_i1.p1  ORF type:complete len:249 (-),score=64.11 TRINITY_DN1966_c0_g3_i1:60-806(-)